MGVGIGGGYDTDGSVHSSRYTNDLSNHSTYVEKEKEGESEREREREI